MIDEWSKALPLSAQIAISGRGSALIDEWPKALPLSALIAISG